MGHHNQLSYLYYAMCINCKVKKFNVKKTRSLNVGCSFIITSYVFFSFFQFHFPPSKLKTSPVQSLGHFCNAFTLESRTIDIRIVPILCVLNLAKVIGINLTQSQTQPVSNRLAFRGTMILPSVRHEVKEPSVLLLQHA